MVLLGSDAFIQEFKKKINESKSYEEAAKDWEGDFLFVVNPEGPLTSEIVYYVDLYHGKCRDARLISSREEMKAKFVFEGPLKNWIRLLEKQIDPLGALMKGKFRLHGNLAKTLKYSRAGKELVKLVCQVPTEFPGEWYEFVEGLRSGA